MRSVFACGIGVVVDLIMGDPVWLYHPVKLIGKLITVLEGMFRNIVKDSEKGLLIAGGVLCVMVLLIATGVPLLLLLYMRKINPYVSFALECFWCYQLLAGTSLYRESMKVYKQLKNNNLKGARKAVSMIVGRDTNELDEAGVIRAAVETVAENTSDAVVAPLLFMLIGGASLGFFYKAVNTMDSMIGYNNETYRYFGRASARLDDLCNYIPARLSGILMIAAAYLTGMDGGNAYRIFRRDRFCHASPNSAQTESACAGALGVRLAGDAKYFGVNYKKEFIGDAIRPIEAEDIKRAGILMYTTAGIFLILFGTIAYFAFR